jgi:hypothetical protein
VDLRYAIDTRQWELRTDLYNGTMQSINPERPIVLIRALGFEWGPQLLELKEMEEAFHQLESREEPVIPRR